MFNRVTGALRKFGAAARLNVAAGGIGDLLRADGDGSGLTALAYDNITDATGKVLQVVQTQDGALATGTTQLPIDDTTPQNTEGDEYMTLAITPKSASSKLRIDVVWNGSTGSTNPEMAVALFRDSIANALAVTIGGRANAANSIVQVNMSYVMASPGTSSTTFKIRAGMSTANTTTFNGNTLARYFNGLMASSIIITEYIA